MAGGLGIAYWPHHGVWRASVLAATALIVLPVALTAADWTFDRISPYLTWTPWRKPT